MSVPKVGDVVKFVDSKGVSHSALVVHYFTTTQEPESMGPVNVVFVSMDETKEDSYGRQLERHSSVVHNLNQHANGMFWDFAS